MIRARIAGVLVRAAKLLLESIPARAPAEDDDGPLPAGHPVVVRSAEADRMLREGVKAAPKKKAAPIQGPLPGSLAWRRARTP